MKRYRSNAVIMFYDIKSLVLASFCIVLPYLTMTTSLVNSFVEPEQEMGLSQVRVPSALRKR